MLRLAMSGGSRHAKGEPRENTSEKVEPWRSQALELGRAVARVRAARDRNLTSPTLGCDQATLGRGLKTDGHRFIDDVLMYRVG